jgi:hypothetical protein
MAGIDEAGAAERASAVLRHAFGPPPAPQPTQSDRPGISLRQLSRAGFGDQLLQYGIARLIAQRHMLALEAPDWVGRDLFGLDDPLPGEPARAAIADSEAASLAALSAPKIAEVSRKVAIDGDLAATFHGSTGRWAARRDEFRALYEFRGPAQAWLDLCWNRLANQGYLIVAVDPSGMGDSGSVPSGSVPIEWIETWLDSVWPELPGAALYVAGRDPDVLDALSRFDPVTSDDIADPLPGTEDLVDFAMLTHADLLGIGFSRASFVASLLNPEIKVSMRADAASSALVPFDPWNAMVKGS